jgi:hypothetical protein
MTDNKFAPAFPNLKAEGGVPPEKLYAVNLTLKHGIGTVITMAKENAPDVKNYLTPDGAYDRAMQAHDLRISRLEAIQSEYAMICDYIYEEWYKPLPGEKL